MGTLDLTTARDKDGFVIYFGGKPGEVDTYTFANALVALSDAFQEINNQVNPGYSLELRLEAVAEGSFMARVREIPKSLRDAFKWSANAVIMPILVTLFYDGVIKKDDNTKIIINTNEVIIQKGDDRVIVPRAAYDQAQRLTDRKKVMHHVAAAVRAVESDPNVTSLGIYKDFDTSQPAAILIPRDQFAFIRSVADDDDQRKRIVPQEATLGILKAVFAKSERKWEFVWNGVKIGATITDPVFMASVMSRQVRIGAGDAIDATMEIEQSFDEAAGVWLNVGYRIAYVRRFIPGNHGEQLDLIEPPNS
jgi:hypothetical protein